MFNEKMQDVFIEAAKEVIMPPAKEISTQITSLLNLIFTPLQMAKIYRDTWIEDYKKRIIKKIQKIPPEQTQEPLLNIIGPAIEASKYYIEKEEMREMFANLVAHSCDKQMTSAIHPSFVNILTQISPVEANILSSFREKQELKMGVSVFSTINGKKDFNIKPKLTNTGLFSFPEIIHPIVNYYLANEDKRFLIQSNVIKSTNLTFSEISSSVTNLIRLGLVETNFNMSISNEDSYEYFYNNDLYQTLKNDIKSENNISMRGVRGNIIVNGQYKEIKIEKGIIRLTQFGFDFTKACIIENEIIFDK